MKLADMQCAVLDQLELIVEGKPHAGTQVAPLEIEVIMRRSQCWYRASDVERGLLVLGVFGIADCELFYCRRAA